jgi:CHAT domain-containing protein
MAMLTSGPQRPMAAAKAGKTVVRISFQDIAVSFVLFLFLAGLSDVNSVNASASRDHAERDFLHGYLQESQREATQGYNRFLYAGPQWARKFQLIEARSMAWRGLYEDVLVVLQDDRVPWVGPDEVLQRATLEASALTHLHRFAEARSRFAEADNLCKIPTLTHCGHLELSHGMSELELGHMEEADRLLQAALLLAQTRKDGMLESTVLLDLGLVASQRERHDEALDFDREAFQKATELGARDLAQEALGNQGWEQYQLGNPEKALDIFSQAEQQAVLLGDEGSEIDWLKAEAVVYASTGRLAVAEKIDLNAIERARRINNKQDVIDASMDLAQDYVDSAQPDEADRYCNQALAMAQETGSQLDLLNVRLIQGQAAALRHDWPSADKLLHEVIAGADSQDSMKWDAQRSLGNVYEAQGDAARAAKAYRDALGLVEGARAAIQMEESRLAFLSKATGIYDDYIHFLIANGRSDEALEAADWSRARTLQQGLGLVPRGVSTAPPSLHAVQIARKANATLLFYWLGQKQSYLWAVSPRTMTMVQLPAKSEIVSHIERYRRAVLNLSDPLKDGNRDGRALYNTLVAPVANMVPPGGRVVLFVDGEMSELNFETLVVDSGPAATGVAYPHFWIEDATVLSAPSIRMFAAKTPPEKLHGKLLLLGDSTSHGSDFPPLPMAPVEVQKILPQFAPADETVFTRERATPAAYLNSHPERFTYIHFVSHGTANGTEPLDSAVVLSPEDNGMYKLRARDILLHPINARLVTISACDSSGTRAVAGEGLVGVSWAFLRAGAHNAIGSLWDVSDASTPELMGRMYGGLEQGEPPAEALRNAKLSVLHAGGKFAKPFYWAPFQLYAGR